MLFKGFKYALATAAAFSASVLSWGTAQADDFVILAGELPPMFNEYGDGREAEIIRAVMDRCGHNVRFKVQPFTRHWASYEQGDGDGVATVPLGMDLPGAQTEPYIQYQNGVSYLAERAFDVSDLSGLAGHSVLAFKDAQHILPGLMEATPTFASYKEITDQIGQSRQLFGHRVDMVIGDGMIFAAYNETLRSKGNALKFDPHQAVIFDATFEPSDYALNFRDPTVADEFDACFREAQKIGLIGAINHKWVERYRETLGTHYLNY